jgi:hypothetical protein
MPTFTAIVTSHSFERGLRHMLGNLRYQTRPPDETLVYVSGACDLERIREEFPEAKIVAVEDEQDWGHAKRELGIKDASCEYLGFFNDDDRYHPSYVEKMLAHAPAGAVYCDWNIDGCEFRLGSSTSGNFIVLSRIAKEIGYPWRDYCADGYFINEIAARTTPVKVTETLYEWNALSREE